MIGLDLHSLILTRSAFLPVVGGAFTGLAVAMTRYPLFAARRSPSLMNFASLGKLRCICGKEHASKPGADRRQHCRSCGCEIAMPDPAMLAKPLSRMEIRRMTRDLRRAASRSRSLEIPDTVTNIDMLQDYLMGNALVPAMAMGVSAGDRQIH